jgi:hypothetical protein
MSVEVVRTGIRRQLRAFEVVFVRLRSSLDAAEAAVVFEAVLAECRLEGDRPDFGAMLTAAGPVAMVEEIDRPEVWAWLDQVAAGLSAVGVAGSLAAATSAKRPEVYPQGRVPTAGVQFASLELPWQGWQQWPLSAAETSTLASHAAQWCDLGGQQWLGLSGQFWMPGPDTRQLAAPMAAAASSVQTDIVSVNGLEARRVAASWLAWGVQVVQSDLGWREQVDLCRQALLWQPELVSWAVVGTADYPSLSHALNKCPTPPVNALRIAESGLRGTLVDAAQGIQLLTGTHLARAHDLSGWQVTQVSSDRYLVEARDLAPWFTGAAIDPDVYAQAAHDFGAMLVTPQTADEFGFTD